MGAGDRIVAEKVVIIGGVAAGMKAAATAKRRRSDLDVVVLHDEAYVSYSSCGLPFYSAIPRRSRAPR